MTSLVPSARSWKRPAWVAALGIATLSFCAQTASGTVVSSADANPWWYYDNYEIADFHAQGIDGTGVTIAVLDSGINLELPTFQGVDIEVHPTTLCEYEDPVVTAGTSTDFEHAAHGTAITALLAGSGIGFNGQRGVNGLAPGAKILFFPLIEVLQFPPDCLDDAGEDVSKDDIIADHIVRAVDMGADIINFSFADGIWAYPEGNLRDAFIYALRNDVILVAAIPNFENREWMDGEVGSPAGINGVITVQKLKWDGSVGAKQDGSPVVTPWVDVCAPGVDLAHQGHPDLGWETTVQHSGTSFATPWLAGTLALALQKYPQATPNQILQSLIHNTGIEPHPLEFDPESGCGYGAADTISLLAADPTQYPDVNPFIQDERPLPDDFSGELWGPTKAEIFGADIDASPSVAPAETVTSGPTSAPAEPAQTSSMLIIGLIVGAVFILAIIATVIVVIVTSKRKNEGAS